MLLRFFYYRNIHLFISTMTKKSSIKYASIDMHHSNDVVTTKSSYNSGDSKSPAKPTIANGAVSKNSRRSHSLDRLNENDGGDSRIERRNRRQFMHLVSKQNL